MKIQIISRILCGILIAFLAVGGATAQAESPISTSSFGIALGQTGRVNFLNLSSREIMVAGRFVDSDGAVLNEFRGEVAPGTTMSFDLNRDSLPGTDRLQVHVEMDSPRPNTKDVLASVEIFSNEDGTTDAADYAVWRRSSGLP